jgi:dynein heavy chain
MKWMPAFEEIQDEAIDEIIHDNYRLWLTSMPTPKFPISVLQSGVKITNEPPKGIKASLKGTFQNLTESDFEGTSKPYEYKKLLFALAFFHAAILERKKYGPLGWNIPYEWMNSDFETSKIHLRVF